MPTELPRPISLRLLSSHAPSAQTWNFTADTFHEVVYCSPDARTSLAYTPAGQVLQTFPDPLAALDYLADRAAAESSPHTRWLGYLSYDLGRLFETLPATAIDDLQLPLFVFVRATASPHPPQSPQTAATPHSAAHFTSTFTREEYESAVARAIEYIRAGDIFQVNLSQRLSVPTPLTASQLFARLQSIGGATHAALLEFDTFSLISNSPELFLRVTPTPDGNRTVITRPIKGTRPRRPGMDSELFHSIKDQAELNMIVDLERNDLGRVCTIGSVRVTDPRSIEPHPTVYHGVATVEGTLRPDVSFTDLLRATFPGGSITGAPKIRAMEIIEELEPTRRNAYCGAIGHLSPNGHLELNIAIRTTTLRNGIAHLPVGGGIVADSTPQAEYEETLVKAKATLTALGLQTDSSS